MTKVVTLIYVSVCNIIRSIFTYFHWNVDDLKIKLHWTIQVLLSVWKIWNSIIESYQQCLSHHVQLNEIIFFRLSYILLSQNRSREGPAQINCVCVCLCVSPVPLKRLYFKKMTFGRYLGSSVQLIVLNYHNHRLRDYVIILFFLSYS